MIAALALALFAQEPPAPEPPAPLPDSALQEPGAKPDLETIMKEIEELIDVVREDFAKVDQVLGEARSLADRARADDQPVRAQLVDAVASADQLLADMEKLLEKLPQMESENPNPNPSGGGGGGQSQPDGSTEQNDEPSPEQQDGEPDDNKEGGATDQESSERRDQMLRQLMLFDVRHGRWGLLPPRLQGALENATAEDLPLRYRRWLEEYHRRAAGEQP